MATAGIPPLTLAFYEDHKNTNPKVLTLSWTEFVEMLAEHERTDCAPCPGGKKCKKKFGLAFSPAPPREGETRGDKNTDYVYALVFDFDHITRAELEYVCDRFDGLEAVLVSTHSHLHNGPDDNCVRIILPYARRVTPDEHRVLHREVRHRFGLEWVRPGETKPSGVDTSAKDISRLYFMPSAPEGAEVIFEHQEGKLLDIDAWLKAANQTAARPASAHSNGVHASPAPQPKPEVQAPSGPLDMEALRECLRAYVPPAKEEDEVITRKELVRRVLAGEPLVRPDERGQRERSVHRLSKILSTKALPEGTPCEAALELVRPSIVSMPTYADDGEDDTLDARFNKFRYSWGIGVKTREEHNQKVAADRARNDEFMRRLHKRFVAEQRAQAREAATEVDSPDPDDTEDEEEADEDPSAPIDFDGWEQGLMFTVNKKGETVKVSNDHNLILLLSYSPEWRSVLKFNEVTKEVFMAKGPLKGKHQKDPEQAVIATKAWMQKNHGISLATKDTMAAISHVARANAFDPVSDYLKDIQPKWDRQSRLDTFLETYCGAQTTADVDEAVKKDITTYVRLVSRRWLIGAVARALSPGCKMDNVLILEGDQGIKKSTLLQILGGNWFADSQINITDKDSKMLAARSWIVEMPELSALRAHEVESQKAFFSSRVDKFRPPYAYTVQEFPRRCVFVGTTNDDQYMHDATGNRRYWPVRCDGVKPKLVQRDRDQIWAEAITIYKAGGKRCRACVEALDGEDRCPAHRWWFSAAENKALLSDVNNMRLKSEYSDAVLDWLLKMPIDKRLRNFTLHELATEGLKIPLDRVTSQQAAIGRAMKALKFGKKRVREAGALTWQYTTPTEILTAKKRESRGFTVVDPKTGKAKDDDEKPRAHA